jgi:hypothetical protein
MHLDAAQGKVGCVSGEEPGNEMFVSRRGSDRLTVSEALLRRENSVKAQI